MLTGKALPKLTPGIPRALSPDGTVYAAVTGDIVCLSAAATGKSLGQFTVNDALVALAFSGDSTRLVAACSSTIHVWEVGPARELRPFTIPSERFDVMALSPDGKTMALGRHDRVIQLWEIATGQVIREFRGHEREMSCLAFAPNGRALASASHDTTVLLWDVTGRMKGMHLAPNSLTRDALDALWHDLRADDATRADRASWAMVSAPAETVPFLQTHILPVPPAVTQRIARYIIDLDNNRFPVRQRAMRALEELGSSPELALRRTLQERPSLEVKRRVEELLSKLVKPSLTPQQRRATRALAVLEQIGTPEARHVLELVANGAATAWLTEEARGSLMRCDRLRAVAP